MTDLERRVLSLIICRIGPEPFAYTKLERLAGTALAGSELKLALLELRRKKWIEVMRKIWGEQVYIIPFDTYLKLVVEIMGIPQNNVANSHLQVINDGRSDGKDVVLDLLIVLNLLCKEQPVLGKKGQIDKRLADRLTAVIAMRHDVLADAEGKDAAKLPYPFVLSLLLDFSLRIGMMHFKDGQVKVDGERVFAWLRLPRRDIHSSLHRLWLMVHSPQELWIRHVWIVLPMLPDNCWFVTEDILRWISRNDMNGQDKDSSEQEQSRYHPFNGWFDIAPVRGLILATPKGVVSQAIVTCNP